MMMTRDPWQITREMFLSTEEVDRLLRHVAGRVEAAEASERPAAVLDELIVRILLYSGLRNSECCRLRLMDTILGERQSVLVVRGTPREDRTVYVPEDLSRRIRAFVQDVRPHWQPADINSKDLSQPLLLNERGRPYERTGLYRRVVRILTDAGLGDRASVQLLRHTYGYLAYARTGGNLLFVQRQMGHSHPMVTSIYAQFVDESYPDLANAIAEGSATPDPSRRARARKR
jgi:integrase